MEMIHNAPDLGGNVWKEIIARNEDAKALKELQTEYQKKGCRTWFNVYGSDKWKLTVMEPAKDNEFNGFLDEAAI